MNPANYPMITITTTTSGSDTIYKWVYDTSYVWDIKFYLKGISMGL